MATIRQKRASRTVEIAMRLDLDPGRDRPLYLQIYDCIRDAIRHATVEEGQKLPSIRSLAEQLGVSHITVEKAYVQLTAEGYVNAAPRSGYTVNKIDTDYFAQPAPDSDGCVRNIMQQWNDSAAKADGYSTEDVRFDFAYHQLTPGSFPDKIWMKLANEALLSNPRLMAEYPKASRAGSLQRALARYLGRTRGVKCSPDQIVLFPGSQAAISAVLDLFDRNRHVLAQEEPGWSIFSQTAASRGFQVETLPIGENERSYLDALDGIRPKLIFATPSNQFPTSRVAPLSLRVELLRRAGERNAYIIEDDACSEYRYETGLIPSLQSLDAYHRVIYMNNFSKTLSPALRVAYLVLPPKLLGRYAKLSCTPFSSVPGLTQEILARFVDGGYLDQHIRRTFATLRQRRDVLLECLEKEMGERVSITGGQSGMHIMAEVRNGMTQDELAESALSHGARIYKTTHCWIGRKPPREQVMIGFACIEAADIPEGVRALKDAWFPK